MARNKSLSNGRIQVFKLMFYVIDFDTGCVESKSKTELPLLKYIAENKLELAVALVSRNEQLTLKLSLREINRVLRSIDYDDSVLSKIDSRRYAFDVIENNQRQIPTFTKKLGQRLIKKAKKKYPDIKIKKKKVISKLKAIFGKIK